MADDQQQQDQQSTDDGQNGERQQASESRQQQAEVPPEVKSALRKANKEAETLRLRLKEYEDRDKTEQQKLAERADAAERRAKELEHAALRARIAAEKGVPESALSGDDEDALRAKADELIAWRDAQSGRRQAPAASSLRSGTSGGSTGGATGKERAAAALRELRGANR